MDSKTNAQVQPPSWGEFRTLHTTWQGAEKPGQDPVIQLGSKQQLFATKQRSALARGILRIFIGLASLFRKDLSEKHRMPSDERAAKAGQAFTDLPISGM